MKILTFFIALAISFILVVSCAGDDAAGCNETVTLISAEQDGYKLILDYEGTATTVEASITSGSANPDDGIILPVVNDTVDFSQAGLSPGNYRIYIRSICNGGKSEWVNATPIIINGFCDSEATLNSYSRNKMLLKLNITTSKPNTYIKIKFVALDDNQDDYIETLSGPGNSQDYYFTLNRQTLNGNFTKTINPGSYNLYLQTICGEGNYEGNWNGPFSINIDDYVCTEPYDIYATFNGFSGTGYVMWHPFQYAYSIWQYVIVLEGQDPTMGIIHTTSEGGATGGNATSDFYLRGVCGEDIYTNWVKVF